MASTRMHQLRWAALRRGTQVKAIRAWEAGEGRGSSSSAVCNGRMRSSLFTPHTLSVFFSPAPFSAQTLAPLCTSQHQLGRPQGEGAQAAPTGWAGAPHGQGRRDGVVLARPVAAVCEKPSTGAFSNVLSHRTCVACFWPAFDRTALTTSLSSSTLGRHQRFH